MCIPDIPDFSNHDYKDLIENLLNGTCIFFGAGISKLANYKLWDELKNELVSRFWEKRKELEIHGNGKFDYTLMEYLFRHDTLDAMDYLYNRDKIIFIREINEIFFSDQKKEREEPFAYLKRLDFRNKNFFVTTNIDSGRDRYLGLKDEFISISPDFSNPPKKITHLHGRIDNERSWILTGDQYFANYRSETPYCMDFMRSILENYTVIFIGYGLRDKEILDAIGLTKKRRSHYWLEASYRGKKDYLEVRSTNLKEYYNINLIPYMIDDHGPELLNKVLNEIYKELAKK